jgi:hypothetical protein
VLVRHSVYGNRRDVEQRFAGSSSIPLEAAVWTPGRGGGGYNPDKPGRPLHSCHTYIVSNLWLMLRVDVSPGDEHNVTYATSCLWNLLDHLGWHRWPSLLRGKNTWGIEPVVAGAERRSVPYLFCGQGGRADHRDPDRADR